MLLEFTDANFQQEVIESSLPVVVDFWAEWCGPCKMMTPILEGLATTYEGRVRFGKINIDHNPVQAADYRVASIPTILVIKKGQVIKTFVGLTTAEKLGSALQMALS